MRSSPRSLKTKLLLMMLSLLLLSVSSLFLLHLYSERQLLGQLRQYTDDLSTAIDIAQEQPAGEGEAQVVLEAYAEKLRQLGVKDVSIADASEQVKASTNPQNLGKPLVRSRKQKGPREYVIRGVLGDEAGPPGSQRTTSTLTIPVVVGDRRVGYVIITRYLDDFSELGREALVSRVLATLGIFAFGILLSLYLSWSVSRPVQALTEAARQVSRGDLSVKVPPAGRDEIGSLSRSFNEMVDKLREHRQLEERLHFAERATALGRLASGMAHEIRNPLNFINLSIDHVRERLGPAEPQRKEQFDRILANVKAEISRLKRLVGDFLSFGKPMRLDRRPCAVGDLLQEVASLVEHKARDQGIEVDLDVEDDLPRVVVDPELLKTCVLNLVINGIDAMPDGGRLDVSVRRLAEESRESLVLVVADSGSGMTPEAIQAAFEPYYSTKDAGVGIGLALTRKIVEDHGGRIEMESTLGQGTRARIVLPLVAETLAAPAAAEAVAP